MYWMELIRILVWVPAIILNIASIVVLRKGKGVNRRLVPQLLASPFTILAASLNFLTLPLTIYKQVGIFIFIIGRVVVARELWLVWKNK